FTPNDFMAANRTDEEGRFLIAGSEREFTRITPQLDVFHTCSQSEDCLRKVTIYVPKSHVTRGEPPKKVFDIGSVELSGNFAGQSDECFE
ncbi:Protein TTR-8, partial [Aphelenchoides avenae]